MKSQYLLTTLTLFCCFFLTPEQGKAGQIAKTFTISPMIGGYIFEGNQDLDNGYDFGLGLGYNINKNLGIEGTFTHVDSETTSTGTDIDAQIFRLDGLYHFYPDNTLVPYVAAGLGIIAFDGANDETNPLVNYGGGVKYFLNNHTAIRGDLRHIIDLDDTYNNLAFSVGLTFLFGGEQPQSAPVKHETPPEPPKDSDQDGIVDANDNCPDTPKNVRVNASGCPLDSDQDGVLDYQDKCSGTPRNAPVDSEGCLLDSDEDGVFDYFDQCPNTAPNKKVDAKGCRVMETTTVSIELKVEFVTNSAEIKTIFADRINKTITFLQTYPNTTAVIEGHTDNTGSGEYNLKLSQQRAENVRQRIIARGIPADRLQARGYGENNPIASNNTGKGRQKNRRVIAVITATSTE